MRLGISEERQDLLTAPEISLTVRYVLSVVNVPTSRLVSHGACNLAAPNSVLITSSTRSRLSDAIVCGNPERYELAGLSQPVSAYRVKSASHYFESLPVVDASAAVSPAIVSSLSLTLGEAGPALNVA
jgi:hypothetical protein